MPLGLDLPRVHQCTQHFFERISTDRLGDQERSLALALVDFGHSLAALDGVSPDKGSDIAPIRQPHLAPWCRVQTYPCSVIDELARQGHDLGELSAVEVAAVIFFVHPELGPAALAVDESTVDLLDRAGEEPREIEISTVEALRNLAILI